MRVSKEVMVFVRELEGMVVDNHFAEKIQHMFYESTFEERAELFALLIALNVPNNKVCLDAIETY